MRASFICIGRALVDVVVGVAVLRVLSNVVPLLFVVVVEFLDTDLLFVQTILVALVYDWSAPTSYSFEIRFVMFDFLAF